MSHFFSQRLTDALAGNGVADLLPLEAGAALTVVAAAQVDTVGVHVALSATARRTLVDICGKKSDF